MSENPTTQVAQEGEREVAAPRGTAPRIEGSSSMRWNS